VAQLLEYTPELRERVEQEIDELLAAFGPREITRAQIEISIPWNLRVSPAHASIRAIALATLEIALWVFTLDDYTGDDFDRFFDCCLATLTDPEPDLDAYPVLPAFAIHHAHLGALDRPMDRYVAARRNIADAYRRRNRLARGERADVRFDEYLEWRRLLIGTRVWLSGWEVVHDFWLPDEIHEGPIVRAVLDSLIYGQILENEIHSLPRDLAAGTPSLVVMHAREQGLTLEQSVAELQRRFEANEATYRAAKARAEAEYPGNARVAALLEMTELCLEGSASLYRLKLRRYHVPGT
jgi:hypothetical protein